MAEAIGDWRQAMSWKSLQHSRTPRGAALAKRGPIRDDGAAGRTHRPSAPRAQGDYEVDRRARRLP